MTLLETYLLVFLSVLGTKTLKIMELSVCENTKQHYEKFVFSSLFFFYFLHSKTIKRIQTSFIVKVNNIMKNTYFECFELVT